MKLSFLLALLCAVVITSVPSLSAKDANPSVKDGGSVTVLSLTSQIKLGIKEAEEIALKEVAGRTKKIELERHDGVLKYKFEICHGRRKKEVWIDANSGSVLKVDSEFGSCDDDD